MESTKKVKESELNQAEQEIVGKIRSDSELVEPMIKASIEAVYGKQCNYVCVIMPTALEKPMASVTASISQGTEEMAAEILCEAIPPLAEKLFDVAQQRSNDQG